MSPRLKCWKKMNNKRVPGIISITDLSWKKNDPLTNLYGYFFASLFRRLPYFYIAVAPLEDEGIRGEKKKKEENCARQLTRG